MNVKIIKLITGEEIIAKVHPSSELIVKIENPVRIVVLPPNPSVQYNPKAPANIGLAPWAEFSEEKVFILDKSHVLTIMTPVKDFINQYNSIFGGLVLPNSGLIA